MRVLVGSEPKWKKVNCKHGHELSPANVVVRRTRDGYLARHCIACDKKRNKEKIVTRAQRLERQRRHVAKRRAGGLCVSCGGTEPVVNGTTHCDPCRVKRNTLLRRRLQAMRDEAFEAYGGKVCKCCGETERAFLTLDHINEDGAAHRRSIMMTRKNFSARRYYKSLKEQGYPPILQVLCMNCNFAKHHNGGVCPHKTRVLRVAI
jgi:hypothetical protein